VTGAPRLRVIGIDARKARDYGIGVYIRELAAALARRPESRRFRFVLFRRPEDCALFEGLPGNFATVPESSAPYSLAELTAFALRLRRARLDLFHATHYVLPPLPGTPAVVTVHDAIPLLLPEFFPGPRRRIYARVMFGRALRRSRRVITVSERSRRDLLERFPVDPSRIEVIPNGVPERFRERPSPERIARTAAALGLPPRYALFVGGGKPHKNLPRLLRAWAAARRRSVAVPVLCAAGPMSERERRAAEKLLGSPQMQGAAVLAGPVPEEDLPALYAGALFLAHPALAEGFGLPIVEAMAAGTPVLTSSISAPAETAGAAALTVDPRDEAGMADAVLRMSLDGELRRRLAELGRARAREFTWDRAAERTLRVYEEALRS
jgi:glycosyltransferase involved in cell wall biosynthesis